LESSESVIEQLRNVGQVLSQRYRDVDPDALADDVDFERACDLALEVPAAALPDLALDQDPYVALATFAAMARRSDGPKKWERLACTRLSQNRSSGEASVLLGLLAVAAQRPVLLDVLARADETWRTEPLRSIALDFIAERVRAGERLSASDLEMRVDDRREPIVIALIEASDADTRAILQPVVREWRGELIDVGFFAGVGRVVSPEDLAKPTLVGARAPAVEAVEAALRSTPPRSVLLVGEQGVGKSALVGEALRRVSDEEWLVFEAAASDVMAGQMYVGMLEGRVQEIAQRMRGRRVVWLFPSFEEALWAGQHVQSPRGLLDALLPYLESQEIVLVGEIDPLAYELVAQFRPKVARVFQVVRLAPMSEDDAVAVARDWVDAAGIEVDDETLPEALDLASHYLPGIAAPGNLIRVLELAAERTRRRAEAPAIEPKTIIESLAEVTGLPLHVLDPRLPLDLDAVHDFFSEHVLGQPDAVRTIVERIALVKAGLTDPTRPLGVFLFVGPTGTGKTEIAKRLAEFLFGSADRLVRLDMTEFQTPESLERLLTDSAVEPQASPLVSSVRKEPFSVVLLDEFEKAHPNIWDVFLQVFDDGCLTDRSGRVVDLRHCVIILTSNVGSAIPTQPGLGFGSTVEEFEPAAVERAVSQSFRPELLNRLDRIVVFHPLEREVMRTLVENELAAVLERRGLRMHPWAVEWDESAIDFLLEQGFTADLGARPLKRAIEQHLLAPLAMTIVERQFPEGDQFLFITAPDARRIKVAFVDPDAEGDEPGLPQRPSTHGLEVRRLASEAEGRRHEVDFLVAELERFEQRLARWAEEKQTALARTREEGFWETDDRVVTLAKVEYLDRLEAATRTARRLLGRLARHRAGTKRPAAEMIRGLAGRLYVLECAADGLEGGEPADAFVSVRPSPATQEHADEARAFANELVDMYEAWAERRGMRTREIRASERDERRLAVSGLGAHTILKHEAGIHVLELPRDRRSFARVNVHVAVAPRPLGSSNGDLQEESRRALAACPPPSTVLRRYRREPSPLVRDASGWRTGRIDQVLAGEFDTL
jgi:ATP-dependent Clp protease ATP-binding subunit ClpC